MNDGYEASADGKEVRTLKAGEFYDVLTRSSRAPRAPEKPE